MFLTNEYKFDTFEQVCIPFLKMQLYLSNFCIRKLKTEHVSLVIEAYFFLMKNN